MAYRPHNQQGGKGKEERKRMERNKRKKKKAVSHKRRGKKRGKNVKEKGVFSFKDAPDRWTSR